MDVNTNLDPEAVAAISAAIEQLQSFSGSISATEDRVISVQAVPDNPVAGEELSRGLGDYRAGLATVLGRANQRLTNNQHEEALQALLSAHAMTMAQLTSIDMLAERHWGASLSTAGSTPPGAPQGPGIVQPIPGANPPPTALQALFNQLGKVGGWLWSIIQTLLTPKGWSIEGGIGFPGLASAKLSVQFGK